MERTFDICCCCHSNWSQLYFTSQIRKQVRNLYPRPKAPSPESCSTDVIVSMTEIGRTGNERRSAEISFGSDDCCADIFLRILMALCVFERQSRNHLLPLLLSLVPSQLELIYDRFIDREFFHIDLVHQVAQAVALETDFPHDHTKDAFYIFVTCGKYGGIDLDGKPEFESIFIDETNRHFSLEPHHPQFEHFRQMECRDCDIQEMAIDRLSRNTVASNGTIDRDTMVRFLPKFELGDVDRKLELYREMVLKLESTVVDEYRKLQITYSQNRGQRPPEVLSGRPGACSDDCLHAKIYILALNKFHIELQPHK